MSDGATTEHEPRRRVSPLTQRAFEPLHLEVDASRDEELAEILRRGGYGTVR